MGIAVHTSAVWMVWVSASAATSRFRTIEGSRGVYCEHNQLQTTTSSSALGCARQCSSNIQCVAYSHTDQSCVLHSDFCHPKNLESRHEAIYAEVKWEFRGSSRYYMPTLKTNMMKYEADDVCAFMGAHLLATETMEELEYVHNLVWQSDYTPGPGHEGRRWLWLDLVQDDTWQHSGQKVGDVTNWAKDNPNSSDNKHCTIMNEDGFWDDRSCGNSLREYVFVCEK